MHEGMLPNSAMDSTVSRCAMEERESITRRTVMPEINRPDERVATLAAVANIFPSPAPLPGPARSGLRFKKPVPELKTDLRI